MTQCTSGAPIWSDGCRIIWKKGAGTFVNDGNGFSKRVPSVSFEGAFAINYYFTAQNIPDNGMEYCTGVLNYSVGAYCKSVGDGGQMDAVSAAAAVYGYYAKQYFEG